MVSNRQSNSLLIGIAGGSGSGKTSVTNKILESLDASRVVVIQHDSYYKDISAFNGLKPAEINFDHPDSLETELLVSHIRKLKEGKSIHQPLYDFAAYTRKTETLLLEPKEIIILEGILIFVRKELRDLMDIKIFIDTDDDERVLRRIRRDTIERGRSIDSIVQQYTGSVKPMHLEFVEPSKRWADVIIPRGVENVVAIDMVVTKIKSLLQEKHLPA
ncbi:MAG: uridine kinase [Ignavibacteriae bacterium]|nr:uridine kinase [Ignavibacteriota bacterium]